MLRKRLFPYAAPSTGALGYTDAGGNTIGYASRTACNGFQLDQIPNRYAMRTLPFPHLVVQSILFHPLGYRLNDIDQQIRIHTKPNQHYR
jgi:hypothetical protein